VIDEAAAIPLPVIKKLLGPYLVFMASTINGYEGTGRSLSLKLFQQLRAQSMDSANKTSRSLREIQLETPIRYAEHDPVEKWLNGLLCLEATESPLKSLSIGGCPHPSLCELYYVNRDTLFSFHPIGETFLQRMMNLYVASHYKNSPNDLQLMSDAPAHHLFVLLPPITQSSTLPDPIVVIQVCLEGAIAKESAMAALAKGLRQAGDLIPWVLSQQFQESEFPGLSGARVVRIATHPDYVGMGYGRRSVEMLEEYYRGDTMNMEEDITVQPSASRLDDLGLHNDDIKVKDASKMPPLLVKLSERPLKKSEKLDWFGVSFGLTPQLQKFWKRLSFVPVYVRQTANELTGEHTCIMVKSLQQSEDKSIWLSHFSHDFKKRLMELLSYQLSSFSTSTALSLFESVDSVVQKTARLVDSRSELDRHFSPYDLKRLASYSQSLLDYHVIQDLLPRLALLYFGGLLKTDNGAVVKLSAVQSAIILGMGLQKKYVEALETELGLSVSQVLALLAKGIKKFSAYFEDIVTSGVRRELEMEGVITKGLEYEIAGSEDEEILVVNSITSGKKDIDDEAAWDPTTNTLGEDLDEGEKAFFAALKVKQTEVVDSLDLSLYLNYFLPNIRYEIKGQDKDFEGIQVGDGSNIVNIKSTTSTKKRKPEATAANLGAELRGDKNGIHDPKGLVKKGKKSKRSKL